MLTLTSLTVNSPTQLTLLFSNNVTVAPAFAGPKSWPITHAVDATIADVTVTAVSVVGNTIVLTTTEHTNGKAYTLTLPSQIWNVANGDFLVSALAQAYTGQGTAPLVVNLRGVDEKAIDVFFSEPMLDADTIPSRWAVDGPGSPTVSSVEKFTDLSWRIHTSAMREQSAYNLFPLSVRDRALNPTAPIPNPSIGVVPDQTFVAGAASSFTPTITNTAPWTLTFSVVGGSLPAGMSISPATGVISGTPTAETSIAGLKIRATYAVGFVDSNAFAVTVVSDQFLIVSGTMGNTTSAVFDSITLTRAAVGSSTWVTKLRIDTGAVQWATKWACLNGGATLDVAVSGHAVDDSGNVYVLGSSGASFAQTIRIFDTASPGSPSFTRTMVNAVETFLTKYNKDGVHQWSRALFCNEGGGQTPVTPGEHSITALSNGDILIALGLTNTFLSGTVKIQQNDGSTTTDVVTYTMPNARGTVGALIRYDSSGTVVATKTSTATGGSSQIKNQAMVLQKRHSDQGVVVGHAVKSAAAPTTMHYGAGESTPLDMLFSPAHDPATKEVIVHYAEAGLTTQWTADAVQSDDSKDTSLLALDVDTAGEVYSLGEGVSFAAGTLAGNSAGWTTPSSTIASHSDGVRATAHYERRSSAGALQWLKGLGSASVFPGSASEVLSDIVVKDTTPYIVGHGDTALATTVKLDQGLGSEQVLAVGTSPFTRFWVAKLDPATGNVAALKKVNGTTGTTAVNEARLWATKQNLVAAVGSYGENSLTFAPGEGDVVLTSGSGLLFSFVATFAADTLALGIAKRLPSSSADAAAMVRADYVTSSKL